MDMKSSDGDLLLRDFLSRLTATRERYARAGSVPAVPEPAPDAEPLTELEQARVTRWFEWLDVPGVGTVPKENILAVHGGKAGAALAGITDDPVAVDAVLASLTTWKEARGSEAVALFMDYLEDS